MPTTFLLATGRSGTVFINNVLSKLPNISSCHERMGSILRMFYHLRYRGINISFLDKLALALICNNLKKNKRVVHIEINNQIKYYINEVFYRFKNSTFIHIIRDPREHVRSGVNWSLDKPLNKMLKFYFPLWSPRPKKYTLGNTDIDKLFEITNINWVESNRSYNTLKNKTKKYHRLKFECLKNDQINFIQAILDAAEYTENISKEKILSAVNGANKNESRKMKFSHWKDWDDKYILYIHENCGELMKEYGYGDEPEWTERVKIAQNNGN